MNELPHTPSDSPDKPLAKVYKVDFGKNDDSDEYFDPEEINDSEVVGRFLSQLSHPGYQRQGHNLGEYIQGILGDRNDEDVQSRASKSWSDRIKTVMIDIDLLPRNEIEALQESDGVLRTMRDVLISTQKRAADLKEQRRALMLLRELRAGIVTQDIQGDTFDEKWYDLIDRLVSYE